MSNWAYVAIAYTVAWGALAVYAVVLARRLAQAREVARTLSEGLEGSRGAEEQEQTACDAPPVP